MIALRLTFKTEAEAVFTPIEAPFKGGILHGMIEQALTQKHPQLWAGLRAPANQKARYALRVPQDSISLWSAGHEFELCVLLYQPVQHLWSDVLEALTRGAALKLGRHRTPCVANDVHIERPGAPGLSLLQAMSRANRNLHNWRPNKPLSGDCGQLHIRLLSPCLINSQIRREVAADSQGLPITLSSIAHSIQRRMMTLEPELAAQFEFSSPAWRQTMQGIRMINRPCRSEIIARSWPYASRNTPGTAPICIEAIAGDLYFEGAIPATLVSLLEIGEWIGIGQKTTFGMGWYGVGFEFNEGDGNG